MARAGRCALVGGWLAAAPGAAAPPEAPRSPASAGDHVVEAGETLWSIAARPEVFGNGRLWRRLYEHNRDQIPDPDRIYPGQRLRIPGAAGLQAAEDRGGAR